MVAVIVERRRVLTPHNNGKPTFQQWICGDAVLNIKVEVYAGSNQQLFSSGLLLGMGVNSPLGPTKHRALCAHLLQGHRRKEALIMLYE